ncbi:MAG: type II secretion system protein [Chloroflexota bacterium]
MSKFGKLRIRESGQTLVETAVALAILGTIAVVFLTGVATTSRAAFINDEQATAESLAQSQLEWVKNVSYVNEATQYAPSPIPSGKDYTNYSATISAQPLHVSDNGVQKIIITINHSGKEVLSLVGYKVNR